MANDWQIGKPMIYHPPVRLELDTRYKRNDGTYRVKIRISDNRISTSYTLTEEDWRSVMAKRPRGRFLTMRNSLESIRSEVIEAINEMDTYSFRRVKRKLSEEQKEDPTLRELFDEKINSLDDDQVSTRNLYKTVRNAFGDLPYKYPDDIAMDDLERIEDQWMDEGKSASTVGIYMRNLRHIMHTAEGRGIISSDDNPFNSSYKIPRTSKRKRALDVIDVQKIMSFDLPEQKQRFCRDIFLFSFWCFGINLKDIVHMKWDEVEEDRIIVYREKTKRSRRSNLRPIIIPRYSRNNQIINRWSSPESTYVFGIIDDDTPDSTKVHRWRDLSRDINSVLRDINDKENLSFRPTFYTARHTFATLMRNIGASREELKNYLGHGSFQSAEHYLDDLDIKKKQDALSKMAMLVS